MPPSKTRRKASSPPPRKSSRPAGKARKARSAAGGDLPGGPGVPVPPEFSRAFPANTFHSVGEIWTGRRGTPYNIDGSREYVRLFKVIAKNKLVGPYAACVATGLIAGSPYLPDETFQIEGDLGAVLVDVSAEVDGQNDEWTTWIVTATYSNRLPQLVAPNDQISPGGGGPQSADDPAKIELEPNHVRWDEEVIQLALPKDLDGKPFWNSALQPFKPAPTFPVSCPVLLLDRNELKFNYTKAADWAFAVNDATFLGAPAGRAQVMAPKAELQNRGPLTFWRVSYKIRILPEIPGLETMTWQPSFLDEGTKNIDVKVGSPTFGQPVPIMEGPVQITTPVPLNGTGQRLVSTNQVPNPEPHYRNFRVYKSKSLSSLISRGVGP